MMYHSRQLMCSCLCHDTIFGRWKKKKNPINGMVNFILWPRWNSAIIPNDWSFCYQIIQRFFGIANMNTISLWFCDKERPFRVHQVRRNVFTILQMNNDEYHEYLCSKMRLITLNDSSNEWLQYLHYAWILHYALLKIVEQGESRGILQGCSITRNQFSFPTWKICSLCKFSISSIEGCIRKSMIEI